MRGRQRTRAGLFSAHAKGGTWPRTRKRRALSPARVERQKRGSHANQVHHRGVRGPRDPRRVCRGARVRAGARPRRRAGLRNCHEKQNSTILLTGHGASNDASGSACQSCHGDASAHLQDPVKNKPADVIGSKTASGAEKSAVCLALPQRSARARELVGREAPQGRRDAASTATRSTARSRRATTARSRARSSPPRRTRRPSRQLVYKRCIECHTDVRGEILKPSHHPIIEGKVGCQDCHEPHGSLLKASLKNDSLNDLCVQLPRRQARPVDPRASAGRGELRDLPHAARVVAPRAARAEGAGALR